MKNKKGQFEIFGVVLIVIILVLAMFFLIGNSLMKKKDITQSYTDAELGQNMLTAAMRMQLTECGTTLSEIIKYCMDDRNDRCGTKVDTCEYVKELAINIFDETLKEWNKKYRFKIQGDLIEGNDVFNDVDDALKDEPPDEGKTIMSQKKCDDFSDKEAPGIQPIPNPGSLPTKVILEICK